MPRMQEFKIECRPTWREKFEVFRKDYKYLGFGWEWNTIASFETLEQAEEAILELKKFPKYYGY